MAITFEILFLDEFITHVPWNYCKYHHIITFCLLTPCSEQVI